ncbi:MAG: YebC/PmpR family DNA-binding transcriptional regulator [Parachlamydiales bacterium]|jgi:YebC/PmpR family DNA-binding regulatory protein
MAGHSKWANIKHRKDKADKIKGKIFSRIAKEIISAVKQNGPDPKANNKLKMAIQKAKENNFPQENIERNIKKAALDSQSDYYEMTYELYGHGGVGIIAEIMTDNKNRISSEIRIAINKCGGTVANPGSVAFNFERKGLIQVLKKNALEDELFLLASENGADDFETDEDFFLLTASPENFFKLKEALEKAEVSIEEASLQMVPKHLVECTAELKEANGKLLDFLENLEDVDAVYHNMRMN